MFVRITWNNYGHPTPLKASLCLKTSCQSGVDGFGLCGNGIENMTQAELAKPLSH